MKSLVPQQSSSRFLLLIAVFLLALPLPSCHGFGTRPMIPTRTQQSAPALTQLSVSKSSSPCDMSRRKWGVGTMASLASILLPNTNSVAWAEEAPLETKLFVDPKGLFSIVVPKKYFSLRRTEKGDLPDEKTGKGRRGSSIYTAGDMAKAEIVAVER